MFSYKLKRRLIIKLGEQQLHCEEMGKARIFIEHPGEFSAEAKENVPAFHFLLEWIGDGDFESSRGTWALYDIRNIRALDHELVEGRLLSEEKETFWGPLKIRIESYLLVEECADASMLETTEQVHEELPVAA